MDFALSPETQDNCRRIDAFLDRHVIPLESDRANYDEGENIRLDILAGLRKQARAEGLWCFQVPKSEGGNGAPKGQTVVNMAACYEAAGRSIFGPVCFNSAAPDDGNIWLLNKVATPAQKERWLAPIMRGEARSAIVMTEPHPGSGSDPSGMMLTTATKKGDTWVIKGHKWFITGAGVADHFILLARTSDDPRRGLTTFLFHKDQPGWELKRRIPIMGPEEHGGHCELIFDGLEIKDSERLMEVGEGMKAVQIRLGVARLTHTMRWLGMAKRALSIAGEYVGERKAFGSKLIEHEGVQWMLGEAAMAIATGRMLTMHAAWRIDQGHRAQKEVAMAKVAVADILHKAIDTAIQLCGAKGYSKDTLLEWMYRYQRQARILDGASEVHKMLMAKHFIAEGRDYWQWG
ncbi:MAG TPA: acyl-CoA dehydrogenase family protein [Dongiaceae bacterium]|jgi:acyl-CoA dehydrogenase|nr:acyl-CoA dehydrogenase family protein [Dongiaceae bacterium]